MLRNLIEFYGRPIVHIFSMGSNRILAASAVKMCTILRVRWQSERACDMLRWHTNLTFQSEWCNKRNSIVSN